MNRETYPAALFPLRGDLSAEAGATTVEVTGLQNIPLKANPLTDGAVPTYVSANGDIEWLAAWRRRSSADKRPTGWRLSHHGQYRDHRQLRW